MTVALLDADVETEIVTMLLPTKGRNLLVPNVSIAEIIRLDALTRVEYAPGWLSGLVSWRGLEIPVASFEALNEDPFVAAIGDLKAAVLNGTSEGDELPFYALATMCTPRLVRIAPDEIEQCEGAAVGPAELMAVNASGEEAGLPNLPWIEQQLRRVLRTIERPHVV